MGKARISKQDFSKTKKATEDLESPTLEEEDEDSPMSRIVMVPAVVEVARGPKPEGDDGGDDSLDNKSSKDDSSLVEDSLEDNDDGTSKEKKAQVQKFRDLTATHQTSPPSSHKKMYLPTQKNSPDKGRVTKNILPSPRKESLEDNSILNIPSTQGLMKGQKGVAIFFLKQEALQRQKQNESSERRRNKGVRVLNKTSEEIKQ
jgi:hypothetical protein